MVDPFCSLSVCLVCADQIDIIHCQSTPSVSVNIIGNTAPHTAQRRSSFLSFARRFPFWGRNSRALLTSTWFHPRRKRKSTCCFSRCVLLHDEIRKGRGEDGYWLPIPDFNCSGVKRLLFERQGQKKKQRRQVFTLTWSDTNPLHPRSQWSSLSEFLFYFCCCCWVHFTLCSLI